MESKLDIINQFAIEGTVDTVKPLGNGLINDTYLVKTTGDATPDYVLQRINHHIFTDVDGLQRNIVAVTNHLRAKLQAQGMTDLNRRVLSFIPLATDPSLTYFFDGESYWRLSRFIPDAFKASGMKPCC